jgi:hypothetical protein
MFLKSKKMQNSTITHDAIIENFRAKFSTLNKKSGEYLENRNFKDFEEDLKKITDDLKADMKLCADSLGILKVVLDNSSKE